MSRRTIARMVARLDKALVNGYRFINDVFYCWWTKRHSFRRAVELAKVTIYH